MIKVNLETKDGQAVVAGLIPPFLELPAVITWGTRVFTLHSERGQTSGPIIYREAFAVALVTGEDGEPLPFV